MRVKNNFVTRNNVAYCLENYTLEKAYNKLEDTKYRCVPVLSTDETKYVGNIYMVDILEKLYKEELTLQDSIQELIKNKNEFIFENCSFSAAFFTIKKLPYIAVLNEENEFQGILTHTKVIKMLEDSWGFKDGGKILTLVISEHRGSLQQTVKTINKHTDIEALLTLDQGNKMFRRVVVTLPKNLDDSVFNRIKNELEKNGDRILFEDYIDKKNK